VGVYQNRLTTEGIRIIENNSPADSFNADYSALSFEDALSKRTQLAELRYQVSPVFTHLQQLLKRFTGLLAVLFLIIGASSVSQFLVNDAGTQINFFWAMFLFIMPNLLSLLIWVFLYIKKQTFNVSWLAHISLSCIALLDKLQHKLSNKHPHYIALFQFYFEHQFAGAIGKSRLSFISHLWWGSYLLGATLSLLVVLATHQVDFIWQTTILSEQVFAQLTNILSTLPHLIGITVPNAADVNQASIGFVNSLQAAQESRISWSNLLTFSLIVYALLPRLLLVLLFVQRIKTQQEKFKVNLSLPYYVQLKSLLQPVFNSSFISDPDQEGKLTKNKSSTDNQSSIHNQGYSLDLVMPEQAYPVAIELTSRRLLQAQHHAAKHYSINLVNITDSQSQQLFLSELMLSGNANIVLYVDINRVPDRGWISLVKQCHYKNDIKLYLILLADQAAQGELKLSARLQDWLEVATVANIEPSCITYKIIETDGVENE